MPADQVDSGGVAGGNNPGGARRIRLMSRRTFTGIVVALGATVGVPSVLAPFLRQRAVVKDRAHQTERNSPSDWWDDAFDHRVRISAKNTSNVALNDHLVVWDTTTGDAAVTIDANSLRVVEKTVAGGIDRAWDWRYPVEANRFTILPASLGGSVVTFKTLGLWQPNELRYFELYWRSAGDIAALAYTYIDCIGVPWTVAIAAGNAGDDYTLVLGSVVYSYRQRSGDTATTIANALGAAINRGIMATSTVSGATLTITPINPRNPDTTTPLWLASAGSTEPTNLAITAPPSGLAMGRIGPEASNPMFLQPADNINFRMYIGTALPRQVEAQRHPGFGKIGATHCMLHTIRYAVYGHGTDYHCDSASITDVVVNGPTVTAIGALAASTSDSHPGLWTGTFTATYEHRFYAGAATSNSTPANGPFDLMKHVDLMRLQITWTLRQAYFPSDAPLGNSPGTLVLLSLSDQRTGFEGNTTVQAPNNTSNYYATPGSDPRAYIAGQDLSGLPITGTVIGAAGNSHAAGFVVHSCGLNGFPAGAQAQFHADAGSIGYLQVNGLSHVHAISAGATVMLDLTMAVSCTNNPTSSADALLPSELVALLGHVVDMPQIVATVEHYNAASLSTAMLSLSEHLTTGVGWFQNSAQTLLGKSNNYAFAYDVKKLALDLPDDFDGNMGEAYKLAGLCLRYLRTRESTLLPLIEHQVRYHIDLERDAVAHYGPWWSGSSPYFWFSIPGQLFAEGGFEQPGPRGGLMDPHAGKYATLVDPIVRGIHPRGGAWRGTWRSAAQYQSLDWVEYTDTGGDYRGTTFWYQVSAGRTPQAGTPPTDRRGNLNTGWGNRNARQYTIEYVANQPRASCSTDQAQSVGIGLYHYLYLLRNDPSITAITPPTWRVGDIVAGRTGDRYSLVIGDVVVPYTQRAGDTAGSIASRIAAAVNGNHTLVIAGISASVVPTIKSNAPIAALYLTGCTGKTVANTGTIRPAHMPVAPLRQAALDLLRRMAEFLARPNPNGTTGPEKFALAETALPNLYNLVSGTRAFQSSSNGITNGYANYTDRAVIPGDAYNGGKIYNSITFGQWEIKQESGVSLISDANGGCIDLFRTISAPGSPRGQRMDQAGIIDYLTGRAADTFCLDLGRHAWQWSSRQAGNGAVSQANYPGGWNLRSGAPGNLARTQADAPAAANGPYASDAHYIYINDNHTRDQLDGRAFQRMALLCMLALFDMNCMVPLEMNGAASPAATAVRSAPILALIDDLARTCSLYLVEPSTMAARMAFNGPLGTGSFSPWQVQSPFTGYALFAIELWFLVQERKRGRNLLPAYYRFHGI